MTSPLDRLAQEVAERMGDGVTPERLDAQRQSLMTHVIAGQRHRPRWTWAGLGALAAAGAAALLLVVQTGPAQQPLSCSLDGQPLDLAARALFDAREARPATLAFQDGSAVKLAAGSRGWLESPAAAQVVLHLERGALDGEVTPHTGTRWRFETGPNEIVIVGTIFHIVWEPDAEYLLVRVSRGEVRVEGPAAADGQMSLRAGEQLESGSPPQDRAAVADATSPGQPTSTSEIAPTALPREEVPAPAAAARISGRVAKGRPQRDSAREERRQQRRAGRARATGGAEASAEAAEPAGAGEGAAWTAQEDPAQTRWKNLARQGSFGEAMAAAEASGLNRLLYQMSRADLSKFIEVARYARDASKARQALKVMQRRFPSSREGKIASFLLGRVAYELEGRPDVAAKWFRSYLRAQPDGEFADQARGRLIDCLQRGGDQAGARRAAREYLERYPHGAYAEAARTILQGE